MTKILISAIGGDIAQGAANIVRDSFPKWKIIGSDSNNRNAGQLFCDDLIQSPKANEDAFIPWLINTMQVEAADIYWPLSEAEINKTLSFGSFESLPFKVIHSGKQVCDIANDKLKTANFIKASGMPAPWTAIDPHQICKDSFPCIFKPRFSSGSKAIFKCRDIEDAIWLADRYENCVFQELLLPDESEVTCAVYRNKQNFVAVLPLLRQLKDSLTGWASVIENEEVSAQCTSLAHKLNLCGTMNVQMRLTSSGPRIFEINARLSSTGFMRHQMGFKDGYWSLMEALGEEVLLSTPPAGVTGVRIDHSVILQGN